MSTDTTALPEPETPSEIPSEPLAPAAGVLALDARTGGAVAEATGAADAGVAEDTPPAQLNAIARVKGELFTQLPEDLYIPPDALQVFLDTFEGPLDLLLYLIRAQNIDILDIPVARITRQYLEYVELMQSLNFDLAAEYLESRRAGERVAGAGFGALLGAVNGLLVAALGLPSIVVTLATMVALRQGLNLAQQGRFVNLPEQLPWLGLGQTAGQVVILVAAFLGTTRLIDNLHLNLVAPI